ncbi:MAG TPA: hypothetical protein VJX67_08630, partial [Blastocatellia bacterium]|nr:hypothetical protein [Blastocatellia bacterium]
MANREELLKRIRGALLNASEAPGLPPVPGREINTAAAVESFDERTAGEFRAQLETVGGQVANAASTQEVIAYVERVLPREQG